MIVDDVEHNRNFIRDALKNTNITVIDADDGDNAFRLLKTNVPDIIITDIRMPRMDGFRLLDKIKTNRKLKNIPVLAYSASVLKDQKERIHKSEFAGLLTKPVNITELYLELMNHLPYKHKEVITSDHPSQEAAEVSEVSDLQGLIHSLETKFKDTWKTFELRQPISEIKSFGENLMDLGNNHNSVIISDYGSELKNAAGSFNIEAILKLIKQYPSIIDKLKV
jgi:CheY-like chemotaxis protein